MLSKFRFISIIMGYTLLLNLFLPQIKSTCFLCFFASFKISKGALPYKLCSSKQPSEVKTKFEFLIKVSALINLKLSANLKKGKHTISILSGSTGHYKESRKDIKLTVY